MEEFRILERKCLRVCLSLVPVFHPGSNKYVCNKILYDTVKVPRIDSFVIKLTHDYFSKLTSHTNAPSSEEQEGSGHNFAEGRNSQRGGSPSYYVPVSSRRWKRSRVEDRGRYRLWSLHIRLLKHIAGGYFLRISCFYLFE